MSSEGIYCAGSQNGGKYDKGLSGLLGTQAPFFFPSWEEVILWEGNICSVLWCNTKLLPALLFGGIGAKQVCS